jgi:hypothetical protein
MLPGFIVAVHCCYCTIVQFGCTIVQFGCSRAHKKTFLLRDLLHHIIMTSQTTRMVNEENNNNHNLQPGRRKPLTQYDRWCDSIKQNVGKTLFSDIQFITHEKHEKLGSDWQREVCELINCPVDQQEVFWKERGMAEARRALNKRRQNTSNAMKKVFLGKEGGSAMEDVVSFVEG